MSILNWFNKKVEDTTYSGNVFYVIDKPTGEVINEMGRGIVSPTSEWGKIEEYAIQLTDKLKRKNVPCIPNWTILAYPCKNITNALNINNDYNKVVKMIRNNKPTVTLDLRVAYYAVTNNLDFKQDKTSYSWMDEKWEKWSELQDQTLKAIKHKNDLIFLSSMLTEHYRPSEKDLSKLKAIFIDNGDDKELLENLLNHILTVASPDRRVWLFQQIEPLLNDSAIYAGTQFDSLEEFLAMEPQEMKAIHVLSAELLEATLTNNASSKPAKSQAGQNLLHVQRFLYRYHKYSGQLTDQEHIFEMEEEIEQVLNSWNQRLPQITAQTQAKASQERPISDIETTTAIIQNIKVLTQDYTPEAKQTYTNQPDTKQNINNSIEQLEKGYMLREQILQYINDTKVTLAQLEWATAQKFITPDSLVEDGTLVSAILATDYFETEFGRDLQCITADKTSKVHQLVCLSYEIVCRRELCNTSSQFDDFLKRYTSSMIEEDSELRNKYAYLCLICDTRKRRYQAVSEKVNNLKKIVHEQKREEALCSVGKMIAILIQADTASQVYQMAWNSILQFYEEWHNDGLALRSFIHQLLDNSTTKDIKTVTESLLCHFMQCLIPEKAITLIKSRTYDKTLLTLNDYFIISLYYLQAVGEDVWVRHEIKNRKEWGSVFDKLGKKRLPWVEKYISEPERCWPQKQEDLNSRKKLSSWAEQVMLYRFCETDDIEFNELANTFPVQINIIADKTPITSDTVEPLRTRNAWSILPPEEEKKINQAIKNISVIPPIFDDIPDDEEDTDDLFARSPDGRGYILHGVRAGTKEECRIIAKAFSYFVWRQDKDEKYIDAFKNKLRELSSKMKDDNIEWPSSFMAIYNEILND